MRRLRLAGPLAVSAALCAALSAPGGPAAHAGPAPALVAASHQLAAASPTAPRIPAKVDCSSLATLPGLATIPGYPTTVASAAVVAASGGNPAYCDVKGIIAPQTQFELELPVSTWQGRYLQNGCGGYCGAVQPQTLITAACSAGSLAAVRMARPAALVLTR